MHSCRSSRPLQHSILWAEDFRNEKNLCGHQVLGNNSPWKWLQLNTNAALMLWYGPFCAFEKQVLDSNGLSKRRCWNIIFVSSGAKSPDIRIRPQYQHIEQVLLTQSSMFSAMRLQKPRTNREDGALCSYAAWRPDGSSNCGCWRRSEQRTIQLDGIRNFTAPLRNNLMRRQQHLLETNVKARNKKPWPEEHSCMNAVHCARWRWLCSHWRWVWLTSTIRSVTGVWTAALLWYWDHRGQTLPNSHLLSIATPLFNPLKRSEKYVQDPVAAPLRMAAVTPLLANFPPAKRGMPALLLWK